MLVTSKRLRMGLWRAEEVGVAIYPWGRGFGAKQVLALNLESPKNPSGTPHKAEFYFLIILNTVPGAQPSRSGHRFPYRGV